MPDQDDRERIRPEDDCEKEIQPKLEDLCLPEDSPRRAAPCDPPEEDCVDDFNAPAAIIPAAGTDFNAPDPIPLGNIEISADCIAGLGLDAMLVTGPGTDATEGIHVRSGTVNTNPYYERPGTAVTISLSWSGTAWELKFGTDVDYSSPDIVETPDLVTTWQTGVGKVPLPEVSRATWADVDAEGIPRIDLISDLINVEDLFYWETLPGITPGQLSFITGLSQGVRNSVMTADVATIAATLDITTEQATYFRTAFDDAVVITTDQGDYGAQVTVPADTFTDVFDWRTIPRITDSKLNYISTLDPGVQASAATMTVSELRETFKLSDLQANFLLTEVFEKQSQLNSIASVQANISLRCYWSNTEQTAECPADAMTDQEGLNLTPAANTSATVAVDTFQSFDSQATADSMAYTQALSELVCWYGNNPIELDCTDTGLTEVAPGVIVVNSATDDESGVVITGGLGPNSITVTQVGTVTVIEKNLRFASRISVAEADAVAETYALSKLSCLYLGSGYASCEGSAVWNDATGWVDMEGWEDFGYGPYEGPLTVTLTNGVGSVTSPLPLPPGVQDTGLGQYVAVESGYVVSEVSTVDANALATITAESLLDCYYTNPPITVSCQPKCYSQIDEDTCIPVPCNSLEAEVTFLPDQVLTEANHGSLAFTNSVPANTTRSYVNSADAEDLATLIAEATLYCLYTSKEVPADCKTDPTSLSETIGVAADALYGIDPCAVQAQAIALGRVPVIQGDKCDYGNDERIGACVEDSAAGVTVFHFPVGTVLAEGIYPRSGNSIILPKDIVVVPGDPTDAAAATAKADANAQAEALLLSFMNCFFTNEKGTLSCDKPQAGDEFTLSEKSTTYKGPVLPDKSNLGDVVIDRETTFSYISQLDANNQRDVLAKAIQNCLYENTLVTVQCGDSGEQFGPGLQNNPNAPGASLNGETTVAGLVVSDDGPTVAQIARVIAAAKLVCIYANQTEESGNCGFNIGSNVIDVVVADSAVEPVIPAMTVLSPLSREDAQLKAEALMYSQLLCFYTNADDETYNCALLRGGVRDDYVAAEMAPGAVGEHTVPAGSIVAASIDGVRELVEVTGLNRLQCLYVTNQTAAGLCYGEVAIHEVEVPAGVIISALSSDDALAQSRALADALKLCGGSSSGTSTSGGTSGSGGGTSGSGGGTSGSGGGTSGSGGGTSGSGGGTSGSGGGTSGGSGSSKDTAIVRAPWLGPDAYTALFVEEQPEVVFSDHFDAKIEKRVSRFKLDSRFFEVCAPNTIKVVGLVADRPGTLGAEIVEETGEIIIRVGWFSGIKRVTGRVSGVRKGFDGLRLPPKTREDFEANEKWIRRD